MRLLAAIAPILLASPGLAAHPGPADENAVMVPVRAFYRAYDQGFTGPADFATADWNHINPGGGRTRGREAVLNEVRAVHRSFLKDVTDTILSSDVRLASAGVAVVTVVSRTSPFAMPGEFAATAHGQIRTFVVVRRGNRWLVMQDHNTNIASTQRGASPSP